MPLSPTLSPVLRLASAPSAIEFYREAFGATLLYELRSPDRRRILHAELKIGDSILMVSEPTTTAPVTSAAADSSALVQLSLYVEDVEAVVRRAELAGASILRQPADQIYGYRCANLRDPFGIEWMLAQQIEALTPQQMQDRLDQRR